MDITIVTKDGTRPRTNKNHFFLNAKKNPQVKKNKIEKEVK